MTNNTCSIPHYDVDWNWKVDDCKAVLSDYDTWLTFRERPVWHDEEVDEQLPYIHEYWD